MLYVFEGLLDNLFIETSSVLEFSIYKIVDGQKQLVDDFKEIIKLVRIFSDHACNCEFEVVKCEIDLERSTDHKIVLKHSIALSEQDKQGLDDLCNQCTNAGEVFMSVVV